MTSCHLPLRTFDVKTSVIRSMPTNLTTRSSFTSHTSKVFAQVRLAWDTGFVHDGSDPIEAKQYWATISHRRHLQFFESSTSAMQESRGAVHRLCLKINFDQFRNWWGTETLIFPEWCQALCVVVSILATNSLTAACSWQFLVFTVTWALWYQIAKGQGGDFNFGTALMGELWS